MVSGYDDAEAVKWLDGKKIDLIRGSARIAGPRTVEVGSKRYGAADIVIATGSDPVIPPIDGLRELDGIWTNREATRLKELPRRLLVLGAGPVGVEMAQAFARMGVSIALVEGMDHVLPNDPKPLGEGLGRALEEDGVELHFGRHASSAHRDEDGFALAFPDGTELRGDRLLVATGRRPRVEGLGLESVGIEPTKRGIEVDDRLSAGENLWAIGDVSGVWPLTHVGKYQGRVAASNILGRDRRANYEAVPRVVFTDPQAASVGELQGPQTATVSLADVSRTGTYARDGAERPGFMTLVSDGKRLTGAYALGPEAGRSARRRASGCSRPPSRSEHGCRSKSWATRSSPFRPSRRSSSARSPGFATHKCATYCRRRSGTGATSVSDRYMPREHEPGIARTGKAAGFSRRRPRHLPARTSEAPGREGHGGRG